MYSVRLVGVLQKGDSVEHSTDQEGQDHEGNELAGQGLLLVLDLLDLLLGIFLHL